MNGRPDERIRGRALHITDKEEYRRYAEAFFPIFSRHNGELVALDDDRPIVEGTVPQGRTVILAFPDMDTLTAS